MKVLVTGGSGGLGRYVARAFIAADIDVVAPSHAEMDITVGSSVFKAISSARPDVVVHLAALANVSWCESVPDQAIKVNSLGTCNVADLAAAIGARMVYMSTDAVFSLRGPFAVNAVARPESVYAMTKYVGEEYVAGRGIGMLVVRANFFTRYCNAKRSFAEYVVARTQTGERFSCFENVVSTPVFAGTLAERIVKAVVEDRRGVMHVASSDAVNRVEQAKLICEAYGLPTSGIVAEKSPNGSDGRLLGDVVGTVREEVQKMVIAEPL